MSNANFKASGVSYASLEKQMEAFDRLPASVRSALANSAFNWAPFPIRRWFEGGQYSAKDLVRRIASWDAGQIDKDRTRVWGLPAKRIRRRGSQS
jgi:hypothetical protein